MQYGIVFDIKEFAVHDGPGIRTSVFLKGCHLRCAWCHNPEGLQMQPQRLKGTVDDRVAGHRYSAEELATILNRQAEILRSNEGGVTFTGGDPMFQAGFVADVSRRLDRLHVAIDTSGWGSEADFRLLLDCADLFLFDLKLMNRESHRRWIGEDNGPILSNLQLLSTRKIPYILRIPLVPGITDTEENLTAIAETIQGLPGLEYVELLPYNRSAGGKYKACGMSFAPDWDESAPCSTDVHMFSSRGVPVYNNLNVQRPAEDDVEALI
jgi:pyruvate formate lyase activating enzyme